MAGTLYLCGTPIGNLEDMSPRAVRILKEADLIAAEDTRNSLKLINHFEIKTPMTSYHEFNKFEKGKTLINKLLEGQNVALITDAGMPAISDPGEELVKMAYDAGITVTVVPGPSAVVTALAMSGLSTRRFCFEGFIPTEKKERREIMDELVNEHRTVIMYEAPHRLKRTLSELCERMPDRRISVVKELTKKHENVLRFTLSEACEYFEINEPKGEFVLVLEGKSREELKEERQQDLRSMSIEEHMEIYLSQGLSKKDAMKQVASDRGIPKRDVYNMLLEADSGEEQ